MACDQVGAAAMQNTTVAAMKKCAMRAAAKAHGRTGGNSHRKWPVTPLTNRYGSRSQTPHAGWVFQFFLPSIRASVALGLCDTIQHATGVA